MPHRGASGTAREPLGSARPSVPDFELVHGRDQLEDLVAAELRGGPPIRSMARALAADPRTTAHLRLPARSGVTAPWPQWLAPEVRAAYQRQGIAAPWRHQARAAELAHAGEHVVISTGTASGKSAAFGMPALTAALSPSQGTVGRGPSVLYLAPTKALAHDQLHSLGALGLAGLRAGALDGDSSDDERAWARAHARWLVTNPDMLHRSVLPGHERWRSFLRALRYVVIDEAHVYRGVFGAHTALVLRRLRRVAELHGARPTFIAASATAAEPGRTARDLTGLPVSVVDTDDSARGPVELVLWRAEPTVGAADPAPPSAAPTAPRPSVGTLGLAADVMSGLVAQGASTLTFARSRRAVEVISGLVHDDPALGRVVRAYRGGYLPEERRALESALRSGGLRGLVSTNALELGIDISGLDAVVLAGWPGTHCSFWQQVGRAGRRGGTALALLIAREDPLDHYLAEHPEVIVGRSLEGTALDPANPYVLAGHLCAAAGEQALLGEDDVERWFGPGAVELCDALADSGMLRRRRDGWYWTRSDRPADLVDLRGSGLGPVRVVEAGTGRLLGTVDPQAAPASVHPGALYVHQNAVFEVLDLDLDARVATVAGTITDLSTHALSRAEARFESVEDSWDWGAGVLLRHGQVEISRQVHGYLVRRWPSGEVLAQHPLDLPATTLSTAATWWEIPPEVAEGAGVDSAALPGALHALEHASIGVLPLLASCDRSDLGGLSSGLHPQTGTAVIVVHDGLPGGAGFAARGARAAREWLSITREVIAGCGCHDGCPACVQSPKCGNGNEPLDKQAALRIADALLGTRVLEGGTDQLL